MIVGLVLKIAVRHQVIGSDEYLRARFASICGLARRGAGEGDARCLRAVTPYIKERVIYSRGTQGDGRIQAKTQYSQKCKHNRYC